MEFSLKEMNYEGQVFFIIPDLDKPENLSAD
jgi:hypothetical protein